METHIYRVDYKDDNWSNLGYASPWAIGELGDLVLVDIIALKPHGHDERNPERKWATTWFNIYSLPAEEFLARHMLYMDLADHSILRCGGKVNIWLSLVDTICMDTPRNHERAKKALAWMNSHRYARTCQDCHTKLIEPYPNIKLCPKCEK